jgi:hypothetical protein
MLILGLVKLKRLALPAEHLTLVLEAAHAPEVADTQLPGRRVGAGMNEVCRDELSVMPG